MLGTKRTLVLGAIVLAIGYFMTGDVAAGTADLYRSRHHRRRQRICLKPTRRACSPNAIRRRMPVSTGAFTLFYMSINIGSLRIAVAGAGDRRKEWLHAVTYNLCGAGLIIRAAGLLRLPRDGERYWLPSRIIASAYTVWRWCWPVRCVNDFLCG
ncbi:hypothetical protein MJ561_27575 [Klebsiella pneumoniae]|nr:hypothetical protein MJ561_27575 [Klebsiella pneumoniae]